MPFRPDIVPIPGTKQIKYVDENLGAADVALTPEELREIDTVLPAVAAVQSLSMPMATVSPITRVKSVPPIVSPQTTRQALLMV